MHWISRKAVQKSMKFNTKLRIPEISFFFRYFFSVWCTTEWRRQIWIVFVQARNHNNWTERKKKLNAHKTLIHKTMCAFRSEHTERLNHSLFSCMVEHKTFVDVVRFISFSLSPLILVRWVWILPLSNYTYVQIQITTNEVRIFFLRMKQAIDAKANSGFKCFARCRYTYMGESAMKVCRNICTQFVRKFLFHWAPFRNLIPLLFITNDFPNRW